MNIKQAPRHFTQDNKDFWAVLFILFPLLLGVGLSSLYNPEGVLHVLQWIPSLQINFSLKLDGLSMLFASLICGIGFLIQVYAASYMRNKSGRFSFHLYLTLFMLSMLGLVLSDDLILLFIFWELTTVTSYLLIGFNHEAEKSRKNALQALLVTGIGGLALLAGVILLGEIANSYSLSEIIENKAMVSEHHLFIPSLILILLGAFTKSAQFPFHFWLPGAMAAPTPVSAYLHSATMVKAGVYLLARVSPIYAHTDVWLYALSIMGAITAVWSVLLALRQTDLKLILAYTTIAALGKITFLLAFNTSYTVVAALLLILAHALYKAGLFMVIGNIDKATHTREIDQLSGLKSTMPFTFLAGVIAVLSTVGFIPFLGFVSKEYVYKAGLEIGVFAAFILVLVNIIIAATAFLVVLKPFLSSHNHPSAKIEKIENKIGLWIPAMILAFASFLVPIFFLDWLQINVITPASIAVKPSGDNINLILWQGFNKPLLLSILTIVLGFGFYRLYPVLQKIIDKTLSPLPTGSNIYSFFTNTILVAAKWQTGLIQQKPLGIYSTGFFLSFAILLGYQVNILNLALDIHDLRFYEIAVALLLSLAAVSCILTKSRLLAIACLGVVGFLTTLVFMMYSAPDVAKTQLLVETLVVIFLSLIILRLPSLETVPRHSKMRRLLNFGIAGIIGVSVSILLIQITASPIDRSLSLFYAENSLPGGFGRNVVNVILVDFRAFDTLGEIVVVVIASLAAISLLKKVRQEKKT